MLNDKWQLTIHFWEKETIMFHGVGTWKVYITLDKGSITQL